MQIGRFRGEGRYSYWRVELALRPFDRVPVDFKICPQPHAVRGSRPKDSSDVDDTCLLSTRRKAEVWPSDDPPTVPIGNLQAQGSRPLVAVLTHGNIHRRVGGMQ